MTTDARSLFERAASHGAGYRESVAAGSARPALDYHGMRERLTAPTPMGTVLMKGMPCLR